MSELASSYSSASTKGSWLGNSLDRLLSPAPRIVTFLLQAVVFIAPLAVEGMIPCGRLALELLLSTMVLFWLPMRLAAPVPAPLGMRSLLWVVAVLAAFIAFQLVPLPAGWGGALLGASRAGVQALTLAVLPEGERPAWLPISNEAFVTVRELFRLLLLVGTVVVARDQLRGRKDRRRVVNLLLLAGIIQVGVGIMHLVADARSIYFLPEDGKPHAPFFGSFVGRNRNAAYLNLLWPLALSLGLEALIPGRHERRDEDDFERWSLSRPAGQGLLPWPVYLVAALVLLIGVVLCRSRFGIGLMGWGLLTFPALLLARAGRPGLALGIWSGVSATVIAALVFRWSMILEALSRWTGKEPHLQRPQLWASSWQMALDHAWFGVGLGSFSSSFGPYSPAAQFARFTSAENVYLELLAELGFPGLVLALGAVGVFAVQVWRGKFWSARGGRRAVLGMVVALLLLAAHAGGDLVLRGYGTPVTAALVAGMLVSALAERSGGFDPAFRFGSPPKKAWLPVLALPIAWGFAGSGALADVAVERAEAARGKGRLSEQRPALEQAVQLVPIGSEPRLWLGTLELEQALEMLDTSTGLEANAARQLLDRIPGQLDLAEASLARSVALAPYAGHGQRAMSVISKLRGDRDQATSRVFDACRVQPKDYRNWAQMARILLWKRERESGMKALTQALMLAPDGAVDGLIAELYRAAGRDPKVASAYVPTSGSWRVPYAFGMLLERSGHYAEAVPWFRRLMAADLIDHVPVAEAGWIAWNGHRDRVLTAEIAAFLRQRYPRLVTGPALEAELRAAEGNVDQALKLLEQAATLTEDLYLLKKREVDFLYKAGRIDEAIALLRSMLKTFPNEAEVRIILARMLWSTDWLEAANLLRKAANLQPEQEEPRWMLYELHRDKGLPRDAQQDLEACLKLKVAPRCREEAARIEQAATP